ncbi:carbohydrate-binding module family 43 protein [Babjeviella inositovora NRRL Y-12698]|uniref:1,3-beta-glucanosyltransferase n=1 Tax=Babjeviella inositovora NRRL Y-12698 TaxID=984486 RepID=A0A1E3QHG4_9ASCO|nr:carbohydrate-binding module family 43 protein [Babjeviella inositovora NRRL Y-12698]ODQ77131.1 carbohydrate-binding module family 43 protein [Babjeviella inositovora NRRL Y-12698]
MRDNKTYKKAIKNGYWHEVIKGNKFFYKDSGAQFYIKGIAYQQSKAECNEHWDFGFMDTAYIDPLANTTTCLRDLRYLKDLGINTVRVYSINPMADHDTCMNAFGEAGIYVIADLSEPSQSVDRKNPSWDFSLFHRYTSVVDSMHKYPNMLGFFAGNEVSNDCNTTAASPFVKASIRDTKMYISASKYRKIPVGYSSNDDAETREKVANYFVCDDSDGDSRVDFYGINMYEWCGYSSFVHSGYRDRTLDFQDYPVPIFFSEFGCNLQRPRPFTEIEALYSDRMTHVWSGGIAYMYFEETNAYGVVRIQQDGTVVKLADYENLKQGFHKVHPKVLHAKDYQPKISAYIKCLSQNAAWRASSEIPPSPNSDKCDCLQSSLSCIISPVTVVDKPVLLGEVCQVTNCSSIIADGATGEYGEFSLCSLEQRLGYALNSYHLSQNLSSESCHWDGRAFYNFKIGGGRKTCAEELGQEYLNVLDGLPPGTQNKRLSQSAVGSLHSKVQTSSDALKLETGWKIIATVATVVTVFILKSYA